jgi:NADPH-dependent glutamate synthase beta subunit-like oxidoreductase
MNKLFLALLFSVTCMAEDIKPPEIKEMIVIGTGRSTMDSQAACQTRIYNSCKQVISVSNRDSQPTGSGMWITTLQVKYKEVH